MINLSWKGDVLREIHIFLGNMFLVGDVLGGICFG